MPVIFCDSWDHYNTIADKWSVGVPIANIDLTGTKSRTGIGCLLVEGAGGATENVNPTQKLICGTAYYSNTVVDQNVIWFGDTQSSPFNDTPVRVWVTVLGSIRVTTGNDPFTVTVCESVVNLFHFNSYNYIEVKAFGDNGGSGGTVEVQCNGALVTSATGVSWHFAAGHTAFGYVRILCAGGLPDCRHDDTYIIDWTAGDNLDFLGPVQIYAGVPVADVAVAWTPSTGVQNFAMVDEIPPNADTDFNASNVTGDTDQYQHPLVIPANSTVFAVQHCQDLRVDTGTHTLTSVVNGVENTAPVTIASGLSYLIFHWPMDVEPNSGLAWTVADFPVNAGPKVVA